MRKLSRSSNGYIIKDGEYVKCDFCGLMFYRPKSLLNRYKRHYHNKACAAAGYSSIYKGANHAGWKNGIHSGKNDYIRIHKSHIPDIDKYRQMMKKKPYIHEHRLIMARKLGRALLDHEIVHHIDGDKHNNNIENLLLVNKNIHQKKHINIMYEYSIIKEILMSMLKQQQALLGWREAAEPTNECGY